MAYDLTLLNSKLTAIADNIRKYVTGDTSKRDLDRLASGIDEVYSAGYTVGHNEGELSGWKGYQDLIAQEATATHKDIIKGKVAYNGEGKVIGTAVSSDPVLYGTYLLSANPILSDATCSASSLSFGLFDSPNVYAWFYNGGWDNSPILGIVFTREDSGDWEITISTLNNSSEYNSNGWHSSSMGMNLEFPDDRYRVIFFKNPVRVSQEFYDSFMSIIDTEGNPFDIAYDIGFNAGNAQ